MVREAEGQGQQYRGFTWPAGTATAAGRGSEGGERRDGIGADDDGTAMQVHYASMSIRERMRLARITGMM